uniref:DNA-directed RNA polymerase n=1 Tax=Pithovirus LCPAC302 TaxID=2506593 RepID=A0A481Z862_9VIRU|nr:MAG: DNA-directed RNA polymerase subunit alpha [Pithovirus LCPAC302]
MDDPVKPRLLTKEEIQDILSVVPELKSAASEVAVYNKKSMLETLREQLREVVVTPLGISDIKEEILRQFNEALIKPGTVVGVTAAEAMGGPITQGALNSFHQSGSAKNVTYGVNRIRELVNASKEMKTTSCSVFFKNQNLSFDDVIMKVRPVLTEIKVNDIVKGIPDIETEDKIEEPWWYQPYRFLIRKDFKSKSILMLDMDVDVMYAYNITMRDVAKVIEMDQSVICVYSPMNIGKIHIYPIERAVTMKIKFEGVVDRDNASLVFLWEAVIPALDKLKIKGITGIKKLYPIEAPVWQIVKEEQESSSIESGYFLIINEVRQKITGITTQKLITLCETVGMKVIKVRPHYIAVQTPTGESPTILVNDAIKADKEDEKKYEEKKRKEGARVIRRPPTKLMTVSNLVYADTDGSIFKGNVSTLRTLLSHPNIDNTRTYCNNVHEINEVLGIEAARSFLIKEFSDVIGYEGYINPRHLVLLVDFMVSLGKVSGITFTGISRQPIGALEKASFEKAMDTFKEAAGFGEIKAIKGTSASIYVGKKALIGTGFSDKFMDRSKFKDIEEEINTNPDMKLDIGDFKDAIGEMNDILSGADILIQEGAEEEMFAGEGPVLPGGFMIPDISKTPDTRVHEKIKGPLIRSNEMEQAVLRLNQAPCLQGPPTTEVRVEDIPSDLTISKLPFAGPREAALPVSSTPQLEPTTFIPGTMGLPAELLTQMEKFQITEPPFVAEMPKTGLPSPGISVMPPVEIVGKTDQNYV